MKLFSMKSLFFVCCALLLCQTSHAVMKKGQWTVTPRVGVAPSAFNKDTTLEQSLTSIVNQNFLVNGNIFVLRANQKASISSNFDFNKVYKLPFIVGGDLGYIIMDNAEVFGGLDYIYGTGDCKNSDYARVKISAYSHVSGHIGGRFYLPFSDTVAAFAGAKIGVGYRKNSAMDITAGPRQLLRDFQLYKSGCGIIGGPHAGVHLKISDKLAFKFMAEILGMSNVKVNKNVGRSTLVNNVVYEARIKKGPTSTLHVPITFGATVTL